MRQPRLSYYARVQKPRKQLPFKFLPFLFLYLIKISLFVGPVVLCALYMYQNGTPHILWRYEYYGDLDDPHFVSCTYLGVYGLRKIELDNCVVINVFR